MNNLIRVFIFITALFFSSLSWCHEKIKDKKISVLPVPVIGYTPETRTYFGAVTLFTFRNPKDTLTRSSNTSIEFNYTWNKQIITETDWNYFSAGEKWFLRGLAHFSKYPDLYYGVGFDTPQSDEIKYQSNRVVFDADFFRKIKNKFFLGAGFNLKTYQNLEYLTNNVLYPELKDENNIGFKLLFLHDTRNNILSPTNGKYLEINNSFNINSAVYDGILLDYRQYFNFGKQKKNVLAVRSFHNTVFGKPPFYDYALFGGDKNARGYYLGRYRENNLTTAQFEYRQQLYKRLGFSAFGGISLLFGEVSAIENESFKPNAGLGIRFLVDKTEGTNLRIDYAVGTHNQSGFYISFGESF